MKAEVKDSLPSSSAASTAVHDAKAKKEGGEKEKKEDKPKLRKEDVVED